jgi:hypothetical protein
LFTLLSLPRWINLLGRASSNTAIIHRTVRCAKRSNGRQRNGRVQWSADTATVHEQFAQSQSRRQKAHRTVNSTCPMHHRTVRWPHPSELQQSNPNGWVTWLAHRIVFGGAPDCPVRPSIDNLPNGHFGGWGYKYPPNHHTSRNPSFQPLHSIQELYTSLQDTKQEIKSSPKSGITPNN